MNPGVVWCGVVSEQVPWQGESLAESVFVFVGCGLTQNKRGALCTICQEQVRGDVHALRIYVLLYQLTNNNRPLASLFFC